MTVGAVIGIIYFTVVKRRHEEFKKTLNDAVVATDKTAAIEAELAQQRQEILKLRIMAEKARDGGEHLEAFEMKLSRDRDFNFQQAIDNDPIAGPLARDNSGLKEAIKSPGDYDLLLFLKALPEDRIKPEDRRYLESVRRAIGHYPDKWSTK